MALQITAKWIIFWILFSSLDSICGLKCFNCDSEFVPGCRKFDSDKNLLMSCDQSLNPVSCRKIERKLNGSEEYRVIRDCVYQEYKEQITAISMECQATGSTTGEHNVYICTEDGCNSGSTLKLSSVLLFVIASAALRCTFYQF